MKNRLVTVFGGSGFVGRNIVRRLAAAGARVRVAVRDTEKAYFLKTCGDLGQVSLVPASITSDNEVARAVEDADTVVNCVGVLYERGSRTFDAIHVQGAERIAKAAAQAGVKQLVHLSALGASADATSSYARSKAAGEAAILAAFPDAVMLRPSVIFGTEDGFFNMFADLARIFRVLPYYSRVVPHAEGGGGTKFQPVYVGNVADAAVKVLHEDGHTGKTYELVGPTVYDMREILEMVCQYTDRSTWICGLPFWLARIQAIFLQYLPTPLLTPDQVKLLQVDNVADGSKPGLSDLGISAVTAETIVPTYLRRFRPHQQQKKLRLNAH
ncbi:MAG: complex I NDUFA9 subunit family protein [Rhodospirillaceae bacterium]|jgi:uncharacterized protein YbjT (DUF2867 family)|nr:complex I NDUFA9 subunit family protein [Rhodospirillaceae bacterium]MBT5565819.1 complex I NDUFA9 subunit family protein [Rhodospirillaceae bacterium]MBT6090288.1 complex I NDUFA9 subunit family protein [Rhodospirillaceae bacterium]